MRYYTRVSGRSRVSVGCFGMVIIGFVWLLVIAVLIHFWYIVVGVMLALFGFGMLLESRKRRRQPVKGNVPAQPGWLVPTAEWRAGHVPASAEYKAAHPAGPRDWESRS